MIIVMEETNIIGSRFKFDDDLKYNGIEFLTIAMLCFICGLKNSLVTWTTFGKIRVTHLTGLSTDIGLNLIRTFSPNQPSPRFQEERRVNILRIMTFGSFSIGAMISAILYPVLGLKCFFIPLAISVGMSIISLIDRAKRTEAFQVSNGSPILEQVRD
jgi:uncharacterized membrane protein YoaK (UPF0700 family)